MYKNDNRIVATLDAGGTNFVFGAMKAGEFIIDPVSVPSMAHDLDLCLQNMKNGFAQVFDQLEEKPVAISFAFPGPADYPNGIIGGFLPNFPSFRDGVALGAFLEKVDKISEDIEVVFTISADAADLPASVTKYQMIAH